MCKVTIDKLSSKTKTSSRSSQSKKKTTYRSSYTNADIGVDLLSFYNSQIRVKDFCEKLKLTQIPYTTFRRHVRDSGLDACKAQDEPAERVEGLVNKYILKLDDNKKTRTKPASGNNRYLTEQEELSIAQMVRVLAKCGQGVAREEVLAIIDDYVHIEEDKRASVECSEKVLRGFLSRHSDLIKLIAAGSLDPARSKKATAETRDAVFCKLDGFLKTLFAMGLVKWESFKDVPSNKLYNMDEVGTDSTNHRTKVIADALSKIRQFQLTPEGDGRMNMHITLALTTRADGKCNRWRIVI
jgi:hypothetical protein